MLAASLKMRTASGSPSAIAERASVSRITPNPQVDRLRLALHDSVDARRLSVEMLEAAGQPHPGLGLHLRRGDQLLFNRFGHEGTQGNPARGSSRLGPAEGGIRNLERRLHRTGFPYLWELVDWTRFW